MTVEERAKGVKLFIMDIDGTLTDGAMYYSSNGEELKRFSTRDGMGVTLLQRAGIECAIVTSEHSQIAAKRGEKLKIKHLILGSHDKSSSVTELSEYLNIPMEAIAYIGDDVNDGPVMRLCGLAGCPSDAVEAIQTHSHYVCTQRGGNGAVREFAEMILKAQGQMITLPENW